MNFFQGLKDIKLFLLDMDGTIYHENTLINGAKEFFYALNRDGKQYAFMTNNSSKNAEAYVAKLRTLGIETNNLNIISSITVTIDFLKQNYKPQSKIYLVGTSSFKDELQNEGFNVVPTDYRGADVDVCLLGFDTELTYAKVEGLCYYVNSDLPYFATNCDLKCPIKDGKFIPDCGSIAKMIEISTGRVPIYLGKPEPQIIYTAEKRFNVDKDHILCVGDRLYTDIAVGINAGCRTALVLTGEATEEDIESTGISPNYIFKSIKELFNEIN